ncbi:protein phosphatase 2C 37-like [Trifolium pratense]|uniref:protein phosphatase 2C 37-like n=1 Tax=Trifolium pratense TaxID=57577 RepID=UPI001E696625|nr:protein phosphatase 2C 37-like [Trifolium pratense]
MAEICCGVVGAGETPTPTIEPNSRNSVRRSLDFLPLKYIADMAIPSENISRKRQKLDPSTKKGVVSSESSTNEKSTKNEVVLVANCSNVSEAENEVVVVEDCPKYGITSVCGRRREMEDSVSVHPSFCEEKSEQNQNPFHFFGVFDGHGCSHVATMCKQRLHEIVDDEITKNREKESVDWKSTMEKSFIRMDKEVLNSTKTKQSFTCKCELQTPHCDAVGSTAVVAVVTPEKIVVSNCGDSRAVLCRNGVAIPLSSDHKPDRPDELDRINSAGGRVIYWDGARVLGVLAMSRAIGDNYLKPYVISEPEVTVTERSDEDECLILASDGLWDVVENDTACRVVQMCLKAEKTVSPPGSPGSVVTGVGSDKACSDASILLTKLALARHSSDNVSVVVVDLRRDQRQQ